MVVARMLYTCTYSLDPLIRQLLSPMRNLSTPSSSAVLELPRSIDRPAPPV